MTNVKEIYKMINNPLCTGCGTCIAVCPANALSLDFNKSGELFPIINEYKCTKCNLCASVCPVINFNEREREREIFSNVNFNPIFGFYKSIFSGFSIDHNIRFNASSGGLVTSILLYALEKNIIDGAIVVNNVKSGIEGYRPLLAKDKLKIIEASKSKYLPIPQNLLIKTILENDGRYAFVGLPCHINGLIKAQEIFKVLKKRIILKVALFCGQAPSLNATKYLLKTLKIKESDVNKIEYRGEGWPGFFKIYLNDGNIKKLSYKHIQAMGGIFSSILFTPLHCTLCSDPFARLSDLSVGDAWLKEFKSDDIGRNLIIVRSTFANDLIKEMTKDKFIDVRPAQEKDIMEAGKNLIKARYYNLYANVKAYEYIAKRKYKMDIRRLKNGRKSLFTSLLYITIKKYLDEMDQEKIIKVMPLMGIEILKIFNFLE